MDKKRVRLIVAYDGTNYHGWQIQNNGITIESELNKHLSNLLGEEIEVIGASRTDSGVHALGNVAVFDTVNRIPAEKISYALNQRLPEDIRIQKSEEVPGDWHPRHCESKKTYEYRIYRAEFPMPVKRLYSYFTYRSLDVTPMQEAAKYLVGEHDFKSFCQTGAQVESTVRTIYSLEVEEQGAEVMIHQPLGGTQGQATEIEIAARHILKTKEKLNRMLAENTGKDYEQVCADTERDNWMSAEEAKEYGLIDMVIASHDQSGK